MLRETNMAAGNKKKHLFLSFPTTSSLEQLIKIKEIFILRQRMLR